MIVTDGESREQLAVSNQQSAFSNQHSAVSSQQSALSIQQSAVSTQHSAFSIQHSAISTQLSAFSWFVILSDERKRGPQQAPGLCLLGCWSEESKDPYSCDKTRFVNSRKPIRKQQWSETLLNDRESSPAKRGER
jgi:hypothetical protein